MNLVILTEYSDDCIVYLITCFQMRRRGQVDSECRSENCRLVRGSGHPNQKITSEQAPEITVDGPGILPLKRSIVVGRWLRGRFTSIRVVSRSSSVPYGLGFFFAFALH